MALDQDTSRSQCVTPRTKSFPARADVVFYKGAIVCKRRGSKLAEIPDSASPRTDLIPLGICTSKADSTGLADGEVSVCVEAGAYRDFVTGSGGDEVTADMVGEIVYMFDDETLYATDDGGTLSPAGELVFVDANEFDQSAQLTVYFDWEKMGLAADIAALQSADAALTAGDIPIVDAGGYTAETDVEGALQELYPLVLAGMTASKKTITADHTTITAAAASEALSIGVALPANSRIVGVDIHTLTPFSGGAVGDFTVDVGTAGDVDSLIDGADLFAAAVDGGPATIPQGIRPNKFFAAGGQLIATFRCGSDDVGDATAGAVTIDVLYVELA